MNANIKHIGVVMLIIIYYLVVRFGVSAYVDNTQNVKITTKAIDSPASIPKENQASTTKASSNDLSTGEQVVRGKGDGYQGTMTVDVTLNGDVITDIKIVQTEDDDDWVEDVKRDLIPAIIDAQSADVDVVSGATFSSEGVIEAVNDALSKR